MAKQLKKKYAPRELMELAVEEGEHSIPEHDDKEDPFVGAIVVTRDGDILGKAHRGELRVGEHCEFTLLERKLRERDLCDCVLYITLEPCTDGARGPGKRGCATHIASARIGTVYVGIDDPDPRIAREAVVNAIIHRDYNIEGATNYLYIDVDKIIVRSPGGVVPPITLEDLKEFKASWHSRNPKIMFVFNQMKLAEQRGKGISSMKQLPSLGFPLPTFEMQAGNLVVTFVRTQTALGKAGISDQEYKELLYIQAHEPVTRAQFAKQFGFPDRTAKDHLVRLVQLGKILLVGQGRSSKYVSRKG